MPVLVILIVISFTFYVFYKIKYVRSNRHVEKKWLTSKSRIALGLLVCLFGINQLFLDPTAVTYLIAAIFIIIGSSSAWSGFKAYKYYLPFAIEEAKSIEIEK